MRTFLFLSFILFPLTGCRNPNTTPTSVPLMATQNHIPAKETQITIEPIVFKSLNACVENYSLRVRSGPGTQFDILGGLPVGTCVAANGRNPDANWIWITSNELSGWVMAEYLIVDGDIISLPTDFKTEIPESTPPPLITGTPGRPSPTLTETDTPQSEYILCKNTWTRIGEDVTCELPNASCTYMPSVDGSPTYCSDIMYPDHNFTLLVWGSDWSHFDGQCILISGHITQVDGKPQIDTSGNVEISLCL